LTGFQVSATFFHRGVIMLVKCSFLPFLLQHRLH